MGERSREGCDLWGEMNASGVLDKTALVFGQMNEPPGARMRVAETGLTMAEYFREETHKDVLLFIDNIFRFVRATSPLWPTSWALCRSASPPPRKAPSPRCRLSTSPLTT